MKRRYISLLLALFLLLSLAVSVGAISPVDMDRTGSILITMTCQGTLVPGGSLTCIRVAEVVEDDGNYSFAFLDAFAGCGLSLDNLDSASLAQDLADYAQANQITGAEEIIDENGSVYFPDLALGLYLMVQEVPAEGYCAASPFLVSVPGKENGEYVYDVDASPKLSLVPEETEETTETTEPTEPDPSLPQTGQLDWPVPLLAVSGLLIFMIGWFMRASGKKDSYEE